MKQLLFCFLSLIAINNLSAQSNHRFSKAIRGGNRAAVFTNAIMDNDTIVAYGSVLDSTWSAWLVKMDTSGNILSQHRYEMENQPEFFVHNDAWGLIKTSDGGYAMLGTTYFNINGVFIKTKQNGSLEFIKYYPAKPNEQLLYYKRIIEINSNYYILFEKKIPDFFYPISELMKTDKKGNVIWNKTFDGHTEQFLDFGIESDTIIRLSGGAIKNGKGVPVISYIDTSGKELKRVFGASGFGLGAFFLTKSSKGWVYLNIENHPSTGINQSQHDYWINGTDEQFNLLWHKKIGYTDEISESTGLKSIGKGEYLALLTQNPESQTPPLLSYNGAFIQKFNDKGDLLWNRLDTIFWAGSSCINRYVSALPLASGNIMVIGWAEKCYGGIEDAGAYAWVVKLSKDGCLLEPMCGIISTGETFDVQQFKAYPNPTQSSFNLSWNIPNHQTWYLLLRDYSGRILQKVSIPMGSLNYAIDVSNYASGLYFYELYSEGKTLQSGKIVVQQ